MKAPTGFHGGLIVASLAIASAWQGSQAPSAPPPSNQPQATFKTGVEVVRLDVTVLDHDRRPLRGLTADDFVEDITVPDFFKADLSMSGVLLERSPARVANQEVVAGLVPIIPTTVREFVTSDHVTAFVRIYQKGASDPASVVVTYRVLNERDEIVMKTTTELPPPRFGTDGEEDYQIGLPLDRVAAGEYLLTVEAAAADKTARQDVRFSVH